MAMTYHAVEARIKDAIEAYHASNHLPIAVQLLDNSLFRRNDSDLDCKVYHPNQTYMDFITDVSRPIRT